MDKIISTIRGAVIIRTTNIFQIMVNKNIIKDIIIIRRKTMDKEIIHLNLLTLVKQVKFKDKVEQFRVVK